MNKPSRIIELLSSSMIKHLTSRATTVKLRIGWDDKNPNIHKIVPMIQDISVGRLSAIFVRIMFSIVICVCGLIICVTLT